MKPIDFYDNTGEKTRIEHRERIALKQILPMCKKNTSVLELGCGEGTFVSALIEAAPDIDIVGADYSEYKIKRAKEKFPGIPFKWCNIEDGISFEDNRFDLIYSGEVIEHLYNPDIMLSECFRILKDNGTLIVTTPNIHAWYNRILFPFGIQPFFYELSTQDATVGVGPMKRFKKDKKPVGHVRMFHRTAIHDLFRLHHFSVQKISGFVFEGFPFPIKIIDFLFCVIPSLSSGLVIFARKKTD